MCVCVCPLDPMIMRSRVCTTLLIIVVLLSDYGASGGVERGDRNAAAAAASHRRRNFFVHKHDVPHGARHARGRFRRNDTDTKRFDALAEALRTVVARSIRLDRAPQKTFRYIPSSPPTP